MANALRKARDTAKEATRDFGVPTRPPSFSESTINAMKAAAVEHEAAKNATPVDVVTHESMEPGKIIAISGDPKQIGRMAMIPVKPRDPIRTNGYYLIPPEPLGEVARVFQIGAEKYEPRGWEKGLPWSDVVDRIFKHFGRWSRGEKYDLEDGQHNLASVAWAALVLMEFEKTHPEHDDVHGDLTGP